MPSFRCAGDKSTWTALQRLLVGASLSQVCLVLAQFFHILLELVHVCVDASDPAIDLADGAPQLRRLLVDSRTCCGRPERPMLRMSWGIWSIVIASDILMWLRMWCKYFWSGGSGCRLRRG